MIDDIFNPFIFENYLLKRVFLLVFTKSPILISIKL